MLISVSFSGGKDSCAMLQHLLTTLPDKYLDTLHVVFADTGSEHVDNPGHWMGADAWNRHLLTNIFHFPLDRYHVVTPVRTINENTLRRGMFPSPAQRWCTSQMKTAPIAKWIRNHSARTGPETVLNAMGLRAAESPARAKKPIVAWNERMSSTQKGRLVYDWLPIHDWTTPQVYAYLDQHNIPLHPAYAFLDRYSCRVCIFHRPQDLAAIAQHDPAAIDEIAAIEHDTGFTMFPKGGIRDLIEQANNQPNRLGRITMNSLPDPAPEQLCFDWT